EQVDVAVDERVRVDAKQGQHCLVQGVLIVDEGGGDLRQRVACPGRAVIIGCWFLALPCRALTGGRNRLGRRRRSWFRFGRSRGSGLGNRHRRRRRRRRGRGQRDRRRRCVDGGRRGRVGRQRDCG